ncbi:hypothetical protein DTO169C6_8730 [Paecilomyces variotii]|nr:hypothetical protein DTO169C6_8730 [Paecilomyces variotii]
MTSIKPPKGWTIDPEEIDYENEWAPQNSDGQCMAIEFGLKDPRPIMVTTPDTGSPFVLFQSGNKFTNGIRLRTAFGRLFINRRTWMQFSR